MSTRLRPVNALLKQRVRSIFTLAMEAIIRQLLHNLTTPPILVYPDWDAVDNNSRPFRLYCNAIRDGGATLDQEEPDGSIRPIIFISRATLANERSWTPLDLQAGSIVWAIKVGEHNARVQRWLEFLSAYPYTLEYRKSSANGNANFLSAFSNQPPTSTAQDPTS